MYAYEEKTFLIRKKLAEYMSSDMCSHVIWATVILDAIKKHEANMERDRQHELNTEYEQVEIAVPDYLAHRISDELMQDIVADAIESEISRIYYATLTVEKFMEDVHQHQFACKF